MKKKFSTELAYLLGIAMIALSAALMQRANFGMSMVVAPAYILHLKLSQIWTWYSFSNFSHNEYTCSPCVILFVETNATLTSVSWMNAAAL